MSSKTKQATIIDAGKGRKLTVLGHGFNVLLASTDTHGDGYMFEVITPAGYFVPPHAHEHEDEYGYIVEGDYEFFLDGRTYEAKTGAVLHCPRHIAHGFRNIGSTPGRMIWISTPGAKVEAFFDELGALPADAPPDMEKVGAIFAKYDIQAFPPPGV
jgi:quercetin dioxygenase-like cupin family protein